MITQFLIFEINFNAQPLSGVVKFLEQSIQIPFFIDVKAPEDESITPVEQITLNKPPTRVRDSLTMMLEPIGLKYVIGTETVIITSGKTSGGTIRF